MSNAAPALYGLVNSNRGGADLWGKNQFNSNFPVALACYMRDNAINPVYIAVNQDFTHRTTDQEIAIADVFGTNASDERVRFEFETRFRPFDRFTSGESPAIDLVIRDTSGTDLMPLEIKLTVLPDNATANQSQEQWGSEIVIRPVTSANATFALADALVTHGLVEEVRQVISPIASLIQTWDNNTEILSRRHGIVDGLKTVMMLCAPLQTPFLLQTIWKTEGKSPSLADQCFDIFVWSNIAMLKLFVDRADRESRAQTVKRSLRECARTLRCLYELLPDRTIRYNDIYRGMTFNNQTDKADSFGPSRTREYMRHKRLLRPAIGREVLREIILNHGETMLSPERRFDATIYFTARDLFETENSQEANP